MKKLITLCMVALLGLGMSACASNPLVGAAVEDQGFLDWYIQLADEVKAEPSYQRIPLDTTEQANTFVGELHDLYRHRITQDQFTRQVEARYPGHHHEVDFILGRLPAQPR
ncbi:putative periplasmic lipoprotein [Chitinimonas naiadis]